MWRVLSFWLRLIGGIDIIKLAVGDDHSFICGIKWQQSPQSVYEHSALYCNMYSVSTYHTDICVYQMPANKGNRNSSRITESKMDLSAIGSHLVVKGLMT